VGGTDKGKSERQVEFGDRVRARRQELGLSQEALALDARINRTYIASLEAGRRNPSLDLIVRLARGLDIDAADLVEGLQELDGRR
jgi:transcriptional regulator with XRE-family HTH domain